MAAVRHFGQTPLLRGAGVASLLFSLLLPQRPVCADLPAGQIVWWGREIVFRGTYSEHTNGVIEIGNEVLSNVIAIAGGPSQGLALQSDRTVTAFGLGQLGWNAVPPGLSNVTAIAVEGNSCWAIKRDGTVSRWGEGDEDDANIVAGLSKVTAIAWAGYRSYLALQNDGTVSGFRLDGSGSTNGPATQPAVLPVRVHGKSLGEVAALGSGYEPLVLKKDGTVLHLRYWEPGTPRPEPEVTKVEADGFTLDLGGEFSKTPYDYTSADLVQVRGQVLSDVTAVAGGGRYVLALKKDGTLVAWSGIDNSPAAVPEGLSNVIAIAVAEPLCMALRRDGTVLSWGVNDMSHSSVPAGLSNVVAIAAGGDVHFALTTGNIPASVFTYPHGRLEEMEREADLIFKGRVISTYAATNTSFPSWGKPHATRFSLISILGGHVQTSEVVFWHNTSGPQAWGGGTPPSSHQFVPGNSYLVFAGRLDKPDYLYTVPADATNRPNEFRQLRNDGVMRTLDARPVGARGVKDAHWAELGLLLQDTNTTNQLYAIDTLDRMSLGGGEDYRTWTRGDDFKREAVLKAVQPLINNSNELVAASAIGCFHVCGSSVTLFPDYRGWMPVSRGCPQVDPKSIAGVAPYADDLVAAANSSSSSLCRAAAIAALSCTRFSAASNSLPRWLADPDEQVRAQAVLLLPDFPGAFCERSLRTKAADASPVVRAAVADAIGNGKIEALLPALVALFSTSPVRTNSGPWPHKGLQGDGYFAEVGADDIHTSAGYALLKFDVEQVGAILKANLSDLGFGLSFIRRLAQNGAEPYLPLLAKELRTHTAGSEQEAAKNGFHWSLSHWLAGDYGWAWATLFGYVSAQSREALVDPKMAPMLDALQIADDPGDARTRSLYGFFLDKGLIERAIELRRGIIRRTEDKAIDKKSFNFPSLLKAFDEMDEKHSLKPGLGL